MTVKELKSTKDPYLQFTKTDDWSRVVGSGRIGTLDKSYQEIIDVLGEPSTTGSGDGKVQAEWILKFEDGLIATIYDYKQYDIAVENVTRWSIGGHVVRVVDRVKALFD